MAEAPWKWKMTLQNSKQRDLLFLPTALYADKDKARYYVVDSGKKRLLSYDIEGKFLNSFTANNQLQTPFDMVREQGVLWITEKEKNTITRVDLEAKKVVPNIIIHQGKKVFPHRLEMANDTLYVLDKATGSILSINRDMEVAKQFSCDKCKGGFIDFKVSKNKIWALEQKERTVYVFSLDGNLDRRIELLQSQLDFPVSLAIDAAGLIYILDRHQGNINVFDSTGLFKYSFLEIGQARSQLYYPIEILFDPWGNFCVVEEGNSRVQIFSRN
jgi:sugar lactone lactonase YvrE